MDVISPSHTNDPTAFNIAHHSTDGNHFVVFKNICENEVLDGLYPNTRTFMHDLLPAMREELLLQLGKATAVRVYSGEDIGTLYAAYYAIVAGRMVDLVITNPQFMGGKSAWAQSHPLMLNKLVTTVLSASAKVEIVGDKHFEALPKAFPRIQREYVLSDITITETTLPGSLRSPTNDGIAA